MQRIVRFFLIDSRFALVFLASLLLVKPAFGQLLPGQTYHFEGSYTRTVCNPDRVRMHIQVYVPTNNTDLLVYTTRSGGVQLNINRVKSGGHAVTEQFNGYRNTSSAALTGNQLSISIVTTNPKGGQSRNDFRIAVNGQNCTALSFSHRLTGCGSDGQDARPAACRVYPGRPTAFAD